jgi:hypothetical protein
MELLESDSARPRQARRSPDLHMQLDTCFACRKCLCAKGKTGQPSLVVSNTPMTKTKCSLRIPDTSLECCTEISMPTSFTTSAVRALAGTGSIPALMAMTRSLAKSRKRPSRSTLLRNESDKAVRAMHRLPEHRFFGFREPIGVARAQFSCC